MQGPLLVGHDRVFDNQTEVGYDELFAAFRTDYSLRATSGFQLISPSGKQAASSLLSLYILPSLQLTGRVTTLSLLPAAKVACFLGREKNDLSALDLGSSLSLGLPTYVNLYPHNRLLVTLLTTLVSQQGLSSSGANQVCGVGVSAGGGVVFV